MPASCVFSTIIGQVTGLEWLTLLEIPGLIQSLKSSAVELGLYFDGRLFKCGLTVATITLSRIDLISRPIPVAGSVLMQCHRLGCTEPVV